MFADSTFFDVFSFRLLRGDPSTCLKEPRSIVLTEEYARKYFGGEDPIGKSLKIEQDTNLSVVTGVMEDIPANSHIRPKMIGSLNTLGISRSNNWVNHNFYTYVMLREGTDPRAFEEGLYDMVIKYVGPMVVQFMGIDMDQFEAAGHSYGYRIQKLTDIHLHSDLQYEIQPGGNPLYVYIFLVAAILILAIAGINFMNLAIAQSSGRAREVGLRKVVGSGRMQIMSQFLTESVILSLLALVVAVALVYMLLPGYNNLIHLQLEFDIFSRSWIIPLLLVFAILVGLAAGSYPAFVLASFRPVSALSPEIKLSSGRGGLRKLLIVLQFTVTIIILVCTVVVYRQLHFMQDKETGFVKENILLVHRSDVLRENIDAFKQEVTRHSNVLATANATDIPSYQFSDNAHWLEGWDRSEIFTLATTYVSYGFDQALGLELVQGRFFNREIPTDSSGVVINQATVRALGLEDPLNTRFYQPGGENGEDFFMPIIGVVKDFHFESMQKEISPVAIHFMRGNYEGVLIIRLGEGDAAETVRFIQDTWNAFSIDYPFDNSWMNEQFNSLFATERKTGQLLAGCWG